VWMSKRVNEWWVNEWVWKCVNECENEYVDKWVCEMKPFPLN
jgi:hypothetical protein